MRAIPWEQQANHAKSGGKGRCALGSGGPKTGLATCMVRSGPRGDICMSGATAMRHFPAICTSDIVTLAVLYGLAGRSFTCSDDRMHIQCFVYAHCPLPSIASRVAALARDLLFPPFLLVLLSLPLTQTYVSFRALNPRALWWLPLVVWSRGPWAVP